MRLSFIFPLKTRQRQIQNDLENTKAFILHTFIMNKACKKHCGQFSKHFIDIFMLVTSVLSATSKMI